MIRYGRQDISDADIQAVVEVLRSDFLTQGPMVPHFESAVANYCGAQHAIAVNSATSALHIACLALDLGPGDWLWTSANTFVASANVAVHCGAHVDFVDIDPRTYNMSIECLAVKLEVAKRNNQLPKIVMPVHFAGQPCDMQSVRDLGKKYGFKIIEDAAHAIGASYKNIKVGACVHSDITVFSFHPVKIITTGEGGMAMTNDAKIASRMRRLRSHGVTSDEALMQARPESEIWNYQQIELGFNYRMTDIQAALGLCQLTRLDNFIQSRRMVAERYDTQLSELPLVTPWQVPSAHSSCHLYPIRIPESQTGKSQREVYDALWRQGIAANVHYIPVHRQPYYEARGFKSGSFPEAERFHREVISLPMYSSLSACQQQTVVECLRIALQRV